MDKMAKKHLIIGTMVCAALLAAGYFVAMGAVGSSTEIHRGTIISGRVVSTYGPVENARVRIAGEET
jgi:hypothetical protein